MKSRRANTDKVMLNKFVLLAILLFFVVVIYRVSELSLSKTIDGINIHVFASNRNTRKDTIFAERGAIYDKDNNILAQTINSYTVVAVLSPNASKDSSVPRNVIDKEKTAKELSLIIDMSEDAIMTLLNRNAYQVELGPGGRGITELTKEKIDELELPGITFIQSYKRYYPNGNFLSYVLGYVQTKDNGDMVGEMGIEQKYDSELKGNNGYSEYQQDLNGYRIPNTPEVTKNAVDGVDIYLTIDSNIQFFVENVCEDAYKKYTPDWLIAVVADAHTGAILASTSYPSFDPNKKDMTNYLDPLVSYAYEPGSTMKTFTYMAVMEKGNYNGDDKFLSGRLDFGNGTSVVDWVPQGWGTLTYDQGYKLSANTGAANLTKKYINGTELRNYFEKLGFGSITGLELPNELPGSLNFRYPIEVANAAFGQGITTTPVQNIKALTPIANDGILLKPYIVSKVVNSDTGKIIYQGGRQELGRVASSKTINKMKDLMYGVVNDDPAMTTGYMYKIPGYDIIGKTGTAQYADPYTGKYYFDDISYIRSFEGMFPKDNPDVILYVAMKRPIGGGSGVSSVTKSIIKDIANYRGMFAAQSQDVTIKNYTLPNLLNKNIDAAKDLLKNAATDIEVIGDGNKVINQYPLAGSNVNSLDKVFLVTNSDKLNVPDLKGWSLKEVQTLCTLLDLKLKYDGTGFVYEQDNSDIDKNKTISIRLQNDIKDDTDTKKDASV